jgi:hypothetical protein
MQISLYGGGVKPLHRSFSTLQTVTSFNIWNLIFIWNLGKGMFYIRKVLLSNPGDWQSWHRLFAIFIDKILLCWCSKCVSTSSGSFPIPCSNKMELHTPWSWKASLTFPRTIDSAYCWLRLAVACVELSFGLRIFGRFVGRLLFLTHLKFCCLLFRIQSYRLQHQQMTSAIVCVRACACVYVKCAICSQKCMGRFEQYIGVFKSIVTKRRMIYKGCVYVDI